MSKRKNKGMGVDKCCECCNNCTVYPDGTYICNKNREITKVIDGYMPTDKYYWCCGASFKVKESASES